MRQLDGRVCFVQFTRMSRFGGCAVVGGQRLGSAWNGEIDTDSVVVGWKLLAVIGDGMKGDISWSGVGPCMAGDQVGRFKEDIGLVSNDSGNGSDLLE